MITAMKYKIICWGVHLVLAQGNTKEETIKKIPETCEECGPNKVDVNDIKWFKKEDGSFVGFVHCGITKKSLKLT